MVALAVIIAVVGVMVLLVVTKRVLGGKCRHTPVPPPGVMRDAGKIALSLSKAVCFLR